MRKRYARKKQFDASALRRYEDAKRYWIAANPQASAQDYQLAMSALAARHAA